MGIILIQGSFSKKNKDKNAYTFAVWGELFERVRERERDREREREREKEKERQGGGERQREREWQRQRERQREIKSMTQKDWPKVKSWYCRIR